MAYRIEIRVSARKVLAALPKTDQQRIRAKIDALAGDPRPHGVKRVKGPEGFLRIRVGDYRVMYLVQDDTLIVLAVRTAHRREACL